MSFIIRFSEHSVERVHQGSSMALLENPLESLEILEAILDYVTATSDLKNARLVAKIWTKASLKHWRGRKVITLLPNLQSKSDLQSPLLTISEYVQVLDDDIHTGGLELSKRPFQRYRLRNWVFTGDTERETQLTERIGPVAKHLHLDNCKFPDYTAFDDLLTRNLPCLRKLVWSNCGFLEKPEIDEGTVMDQLERGHRQRTNFQRSVRILEVTSDFNELFRVDSGNAIKLLYSLPNLKELIIQTEKNDYQYIDFARDSNIISLLCAINNSFRLHSDDNGAVRDDYYYITELDIMDFFADAGIIFSKAFRRNDQYLKFRVERLSIDVGALTIESDAKCLFSNRAFVNSLKVLKALRAPIIPPYETVPFITEMEALEELHLWGTFTTNLEFLRNTPNLKMLVLKSDCYDKQHKFNGIILKELLTRARNQLSPWPNDLVVSTLSGVLSDEELTVTTLHHIDIDYKFSPESIPHLAKWLPNVTTLKMVLDNGLLDAVSTVWPKLRELECLFGSRVDDDGITCLLRFKNLKKFKSNAYCNQGLVSSSSVDRVFLKMEALEELDICVSYKMSQSAVEELKRKIWRVKVVRNYSYVVFGKKHSHECCDRVKFLSTPPTNSINFIQDRAKKLIAWAKENTSCR